MAVTNKGDVKKEFLRGMTMTCKLCKKFREKHPLNKEGKHVLSEISVSDPIKCAFEDSNIFSGNNWNCQSMIELRAIAGEQENSIYYDERVTFYTRHNDGSIGVVPTTLCAVQEGFVVMNWHKSRGTTDSAYIIEENSPTEPLELFTVECILKEFGDYKRGK